MASASFLGGMAEAVFLVTITRLAFAITEGNDQVGIVADQFLSINQTLFLAVGLVVTRVIFAGLAVWQTTRIAASVVARVRRRLTRAFLNSAWEVQQAQKGGSLQQLIGGYSGQANAMMSGVGTTVVAMANLVAMLGLAAAVDPAGALVMVASILILGLLLRPIRKAVRRRARKNNQAGMELGVGANEVSQLGLELHVFHVQSEAGQQLEGLIDKARDSSRRLSFASGSLSTIYSALAYIALIVALSAVAQSDAADLTSLGAVLLVMLRSLAYGQALQGSYLGVVSAAPAIDELLERLDVFDRGKRSDGGQPLDSVGVIEMDRVTFSYSGQQPTLHDITFQLQPREIIGIVGPSGGGKSTLVQLLLGLRDAQEGAIRTDGKEISSFSKAEWARRVTFVPQAAHLISGSVADNIRFMRLGVTDDAVERAARLAHLHDDIANFPRGYDHSVGEQGGHLSGGQQQRLCIARALVEDPDVMILDEPTSALDVKSEHLIRTTLLGLKERMTVIVIAHRLSTLNMCDRIMVIQGGRLMGFDVPSQLEQSNDFYLQAMQLSGLR